MHLDVEQIERLLHGELDPGPEASARTHLRECAYCKRRLERAKREEADIFGLLEHLDHPVPSVDVETLVEKASPHRWRWGRIAAGIVLVLAISGMLYAVPGSPLPDLLRSATRWLSPADVPEAEHTPTVPTTTHVSGIAVEPGPNFTVRFAAPQVRGTATVRLVDSSKLAIRAFGEPVAFNLDTNEITVANAGVVADYEILIPRDASSLRIEIGSTTVLRKENGEIRAIVQPDSTGHYRLPLTLSGDD